MYVDRIASGPFRGCDASATHESLDAPEAPTTSSVHATSRFDAEISQSTVPSSPDLAVIFWRTRYPPPGCRIALRTCERLKRLPGNIRLVPRSNTSTKSTRTPPSRYPARCRRPEGEDFFKAPAAVASDVLGATSSRNVPRSRFRSTVTTSFRAANASEEGEEGRCCARHGAFVRDARLSFSLVAQTIRCVLTLLHRYTRSIPVTCM